MDQSSETKPGAGDWGQRIRHRLGYIFGNSSDCRGSNNHLDRSLGNLDMDVGGNNNSGQNGVQEVGSVDVDLNGGPDSTTRTQVGYNTNSGGKQTIGDVKVKLANRGSFGHNTIKAMPSARIDRTRSDTGRNNISIEDRPNENYNGEQNISSPVFKIQGTGLSKLDAKFGGNINEGKKQTVGALQFTIHD
ncbi:uncharacterized protein LOC141594213 isoform X2 [Silene latifolia]|uniref:uncharacterized protein LOC141594213 isoform X2 n=1 Tax=Silene latifolia TaxID=37657 RepID=UPI003D77D571